MTAKLNRYLARRYTYRLVFTSLGYKKNPFKSFFFILGFLQFIKLFSKTCFPHLLWITWWIDPLEPTQNVIFTRPATTRPLFDQLHYSLIFQWVTPI